MISTKNLLQSLWGCWLTPNANHTLSRVDPLAFSPSLTPSSWASPRHKLKTSFIQILWVCMLRWLEYYKTGEYIQSSCSSRSNHLVRDTRKLYGVESFVGASIEVEECYQIIPSWSHTILITTTLPKARWVKLDTNLDDILSWWIYNGSMIRANWQFKLTPTLEP